MLPEPVVLTFRAHRKNLQLHLTAIRTNLAWTLVRTKSRPHGLPAPLIVSLTSYPERFKTLALTIKCLLSQSVTPDAVILWIAHGDKEALPGNVLRLQSAGLRIEFTEDLRSYKKIIPALRRFPGAFIVTADDDVYYWPTWLAELVAAYSPDRREILCHRVNRIRLGDDGRPLPYGQWDFEYDGSEASPLIFPTGVGGVLYPPGILPAETVDDATFRALCPSTDDAWLYWMGLRAGAQFRRTGIGDPAARGAGACSRLSMTPWPGSQEVSLWRANVPDGGGNDDQIRNLIDRFGFPPRPAGGQPAGRPSGFQSPLQETDGRNPA